MALFFLFRLSIPFLVLGPQLAVADANNGDGPRAEEVVSTKLSATDYRADMTVEIHSPAGVSVGDRFETNSTGWVVAPMIEVTGVDQTAPVWTAKYFQIISYGEYSGSNSPMTERMVFDVPVAVSGGATEGMSAKAETRRTLHDSVVVHIAGASLIGVAVFSVFVVQASKRQQLLLKEQEQSRGLAALTPAAASASL